MKLQGANFMTTVVINDILPRTQAVASGGQTVYSTTWTANVATDVQVYSRPANTPANDVTQILSTSDYSVAFIGNDQTVQVTLNTPSTAGDIVTIIRNTPSDRLNFYSNTNFTPQMLNNDFGIMTMVDQQAQMVNQEIAPRYNYSELLNQNAATEDVILPLLGANQAWVKNAGNTAIVAVTIPPSGPAPSNSTYILESADVNLPNSYVLTAGTGIGFTLGVGTLTVKLSTPVAMANGGTNANLTATNNNLVYSTASALALLATANNGVLVTDGSGVPSIGSTIPSAVQSNITRLGTQVVALNMGNNLINNVTDPVSNQDAATKHYVDTTALNGTSVYAASASNLTVTQSGAGVGATLTNAGAQATLALDGVNPPLGSNVLIKNIGSGGTAANYGIYTVSNVGSNSTNWVLTRATSYDTVTEINNTGLILVQNGTTLVGTAWYNSATIVTVDTTNFVFTQFGNVIFPINLAQGGTNASLTASNGGIFYSTASAGAILAGTATARQILMSGASTTPAWSTATYPSTTTINQLLYSSSNNVITGLATVNNAILTTNGSGVPTWSTAGSTPVNKVNMQVFTSTGASTYTPTSGTQYADIIVQGAGGAGAATTGGSGISSGGGGGAGGFARRVFTIAQIGASATVTIGTGGVSGSDGGNTSIALTGSGTITMTGSGGGHAAPVANTNSTGSQVVGSGGTGGSATNGTINITGASGNYGFGIIVTGSNFIIVGSAGAASLFGGGAPSIAGTSGSGGAGAIASNYGAGGGGSIATTTNQAGGTGANGVCIIIEYVSA